MPRHSKHSCSNSGKFSNYERGLLQYGTKKERLGKDSIKNFDSCSLCLNDVRIPMACNKGHLYCKECILTSFIDQKKELKRKEKEWEQQQKKIKEENDIKNEKEEKEKIKEFEKSLHSLEKVGSEENNNKITTTTTTTTTTSTSMSTPNIQINKDKDNKDNKVQESEVKLNSFWIPGVGPESKEKAIEKPKNFTVCPEGNHPLKSKQLITVNFSTIKGSDNSDSNKYCCPICQKTLTNSTKHIRLLKRCGHVFCSCFDQFKNEACYICEKPYSPEDIISLQRGGTGFSSNNSLEAQKYTPTAVI
ncbi:hypothetical protein DICPUDRAFT_152871 [Dictyostelium purpureum]|uniref:Nitric oxide synthase-interacting protein homolog n=1 Tax=Dictyostelium purpureum TaxID=5786 RepID=F0ZMH5_DICPU|nr:uncharacterized protein DICPUDRAFT_152871 [Dictyostelium purpureum]EGC34869.1 hypothetical protein DICPUDRAFT_152871 [Dictyostelium purpureum]|eukprot:XP_003288623.1 hypothetical protein DICPUDRAFT_152871 [Dictyostelium purpureum]